MSLQRAWAVCDRCGFEYRQNAMYLEATKALVCYSCNDGKFDRLRHPQNKPARPRREGRPVPNGTAPIDLTVYLTTEDGDLILTEAGEKIVVTPEVWALSMSVYTGAP